MSAFERFWTSYPARIAVRALERCFPTWFHEMTWQWGEQEAVIRRELLEKAEHCNSARKLKEIIQRTHYLILTMLNQNYGGLPLEEHVPAVSIRNFSQIYTIIMTLLCFRASERVSGLREDLMSICREPHLIDKMWSMLVEAGDEQNAQARRVWDECLQVLGGDSVAQWALFCGLFVIKVNRASDEMSQS